MKISTSVIKDKILFSWISFEYLSKMAIHKMKRKIAIRRKYFKDYKRTEERNLNRAGKEEVTFLTKLSFFFYYPHW